MRTPVGVHKTCSGPYPSDGGIRRFLFSVFTTFHNIFTTMLLARLFSAPQVRYPANQPCLASAPGGGGPSGKTFITIFNTQQSSLEVGRGRVG